MRLGRLILVLATLVTILLFPIVARDALQTVGMTNAYAQTIGRDRTGAVYKDNGNDNDETDNENVSGDNDNDACYQSLNSNEEVPCDFDQDSRRASGKRAERRGGESVNRPTKCFDAREISTIQLGTGSYDVTVQVMPHSSFNQTTRMTLRAIDPATAPSPGAAGTLVDSVVFALDAQAGCDGVAIGTLPNTVNMGIVYNVVPAADKSKLQIVKLEGSTWTNVSTIPDPVAGNPYVSTSIMSAGTYALIQRP